MVWLPDGEKIGRYVYSFDMIHERGIHTDTHTETQHDGIGGAYA